MLQELLPDAQEIKLVMEYKGDIPLLGNVSLCPLYEHRCSFSWCLYSSFFYLVVHTGRKILLDDGGCKIGRETIGASYFSETVHPCFQEVGERVDTLLDACLQLRESGKFKKLLEVVLMLGNQLNHGEEAVHSAAKGFTLASLLKLAQTKSFDQKTTFLHYTASFVDEKVLIEN